MRVEKYLNKLDPSVTEINLDRRKLKCLPNLDKFKNLKILKCEGNNLTELSNLPKTLKKLYCSRNNIKRLGYLPKNLRLLDCSNNEIETIDNSPKKLRYLDCHCNY